MSISPIYTADAKSTGGRDGKAIVPDAGLEIALASPPELGGNGQGANPEQLFAAGYAACYIGAMQFATTQDDSLPKVPADVEVTGEVGIGPRAAGGFGLKVHLKVSLPGVEHAAAERLTEVAHGICPYSNAVRGNVEVTTELL